MNFFYDILVTIGSWEPISRPLSWHWTAVFEILIFTAYFAEWVQACNLYKGISKVSTVIAKRNSNREALDLALLWETIKFFILHSLNNALYYKQFTTKNNF